MLVYLLDPTVTPTVSSHARVQGWESSMIYQLD